MVGVVVRKDNPFNIRCLADLAQPQIKILNVELEKMEELQNRHKGIRENISISILTGEEGVQKWLGGPPPDAWITYESWYVQLRDHSEFVRLPDEEAICRYTPIALSIRSQQRKKAKDFIDFIKSDEGRKIFYRWGWT
jgi:accessory colonization factor AcfC